MTTSLFSSIGPMLAAPWRQRRNAGSLWGLGLIVFMAMLGPAAVFALSVLTQLGVGPLAPSDPSQASQLVAHMRHGAVSVTMWALCVLVLGAWALTVSNLLDQNKPVLAHLVPAHPARLRVALIAAWAGSVGLVALFVGVRFDQPLLTMTITAPVLAVLALSVRWPMVWILGAIAPIGVEAMLKWPGREPLMASLRAQWAVQPGAIAATLAAVSVVILVGLIQSGGRRHVASDEVRRNRIKRFQMRATGAQPVVAGKRGALDRFMSRTYFAWWRRVLARPQSPAFSRVMLGLGPGVHWTNIVTVVACTGVVIVAAQGVFKLGAVVVPALFHDFVPLMIMGATVGILPGLMGNSLQVHARLQQTRREQALLVLLPGAPRGAALSRRLAWQFTGQFAMALVGAVLLARSLMALHSGVPNVPVLPMLNRLVWLFAVGGLPLAVMQWRAWARAGAPTALGALLPMLGIGLVMGAIAFGSGLDWWTDGQAASGVAAATVALCALRWWRMGREPQALPIGRLA